MATALSGFGAPVVIFIATLFVVIEGLEASGVTAWAGQMPTEGAGTGRSRLLVAVMALATPSNMMVMGPGGYRFGDYWKFVLAMMVVWLAVAMLLIPVVWPFE